MKYIMFAIKSYVKDCWHDFLHHNLQKFYEDKIHFVNHKRGSLWLYIRQDLFARKMAKAGHKEYELKKKEYYD